MKDRRLGQLHTQCKECYKAHRRTYYAEHYAKYRDQYLLRAKLRRRRLRLEFRAKMLAYLSNKACVDCGETDLRVFELDHIDPTRKIFSVSQATTLGYAWEDVENELTKCRVLCANCHKKRTAQQFGWYKAK